MILRLSRLLRSSGRSAGWRATVGVLALGALSLAPGAHAQLQIRPVPPPAPATQPPATSTPTLNPPPATPGAPTAPVSPEAAANGIRVLLIPMQETTVVAQIVGQINRLGGEIGASVRKGAPLVVFDCSELTAKMGMSEAELVTAREQHEAKLRLQGLNAAGEVEVTLAAAAVERARAQVEFSKAQLRQCVIPAPFAGRIVKLHVRQYQGVTAGQPLVDLVSGGALKVRLNAPSRWLAWLKPGAAFEVHIDETGRAYPAVVTAVNGRVDAVSQSVELEGRINGNFAELLAGMSGNAVFSQAK